MAVSRTLARIFGSKAAAALDSEFGSSGANGAALATDLLSISLVSPPALTAGVAINFDPNLGDWQVDQVVGTALALDTDPSLLVLPAGLLLMSYTIRGPHAGAPSGVQGQYIAGNGARFLPYDTGDPWLPFVQTSANHVEIAGSQAFMSQATEGNTGPPLGLVTFGNADPWTPEYVGMDIRLLTATV